MQKLTQIIQGAKKGMARDDQAILNLIREYLQVMILKAIYQSPYGKGLSFMGGTCLRICHNLKRYSEDLDFALDKSISGYSFHELTETVARFLKNTDFEVDFKAQEDKIVQKSFIRVSKVLHTFGLSPLLSQKIHVKLEVDTNPVKINSGQLETFFVTKFDEVFPILKHADPTLFAGKICAVLNRTYTKGRDFYDLIWYLNRKMPIDFKYLNSAFKQAGLTTQFHNADEVMKAIDERVKKTDSKTILKDIGVFLEDISEAEWLKAYPQVFKQAAKQYLEKQ